ncbi:MAG TPA: hypothetical protein VJ738_01845 [Steroidobacteraceae bacterium]|nr:hypothetical protein [Steroidobacteraceae bacterium]
MAAMKRQVGAEPPGGARAREWKNEEAAAAHIGMSVSYLRMDRLRGNVGNRTPGPAYYKIGRSVRYDVRDLDTWLEGRRVDRTPQVA